MTKRVLNKIQENTKGARKSLAVLIDPDDLDESGLVQCLNRCIENKVDYIFVGGSHVTSNFIHESFSLLFHNSFEEICMLDRKTAAIIGA